MRTGKHSFFRDERGVEIIEFAFMLPLLALLLAGSIEFGRAFYAYNVLTKSVRNAARYLSDTQISPAGVIDAQYVTRTTNMAVYGNIAGSGTKILPDLLTSHINVTGTATPGPRTGQFYVTVSADYPLRPLFGSLLPNARFRPKVTMLFVGFVNGT